MAAQTRWKSEYDDNHSRWYIDRFRRLAADGEDLAGEARLLDAILAPQSRILDAGCGTGRVGAELAARGHTVVGVDADAELIAAAAADYPGPRWLVADLTELDLTELDLTGHDGRDQGVDAADRTPFDAAVIAGNVMTFLAPGSEQLALTQVARQIRPDGVIVVGFGLGRGYPLVDFDAHCAAAGLDREHRFATWDLRPWQPAAEFAVTVLRVPA